MWGKIHYHIFPYLKVRLQFLWWQIKYHGDRKELGKMLHEKMERNIEKTRENLHNALRVMPTDVDEAERHMLLEAIRKHEEIAQMYREQRKN